MALPVSVGVMARREEPPERLATFARRVEAGGFDELWVVEDCFFAGGVAQAATALAVTRRIIVGLGIAPAVARSPAILAMEFATLARMHPGRFCGGIGHGVAAWMEQIGARPASWLAALEETTTAVRALLAGESVSVDGRQVRLRNVRLDHPPQEPPPVVVGVRNAKSLALAGRCADGTILIEGSSPAYARWARERIEEGRRAASVARPHRLTVYALCAVSQADPAAARQAVREAVAEMLVDPGAAVLIDALAYADHLRRMAAEGAAALAGRMPDAWLTDLAITGSPEEGAASVRALAMAGVGSVILVPPAGYPVDTWMRDVTGSLLPLVRNGT